MNGKKQVTIFSSERALPFRMWLVMRFNRSDIMSWIITFQNGGNNIQPSFRIRVRWQIKCSSEFVLNFVNLIIEKVVC